jgi:hypothetical protein
MEEDGGEQLAWRRASKNRGSQESGPVVEKGGKEEKMERKRGGGRSFLSHAGQHSEKNWEREREREKENEE